MKMEYKLLGFDLDGTILTGEKKLTARTKRALEEAIAQGMIVLPATGRPFSGIPKEIMEVKGIRYALTSNGARIVDAKDGTIVYEKPVPKEITEKILDIYDKYDTLQEIYFQGVGYISEHDLQRVDQMKESPAMAEYVRSTRKVVKNIRETARQLPGGVDKVHAIFADQREKMCALRELLGYEAITLEENEFTTQWHTTATTDEQEEFIRSHAVVATDVGRLTLSEQASYQEAMGETLYNSYTRVVYVFPDSVCQNLLSVNRNRYIQTSKELSYSDAAALENRFIKVYPELSENGVGYSIRLSTLQINEAKGMNFILKTAMIYGAVVLMVICLTILSLQQLLDAGQYRYRFAVLRKLGVEEQDIKGLVMKQLGVWFGLPVVVSIIVSAIVVAYFLQSVSVEISAYIGIGALITQLSITIFILILLLVCYFLSTWILFRRSITE